MNVTSRSGFNVIELSVMVLVIAVFISVLAAACGINAWSSGLAILSSRGKDIYVSIIGANTDRYALGLPFVWPSDDEPFTNAMGEVECFNFSNSTDYFRYLYDEGHAGTDAWNPFLEGFDYSKLAGNGVPRCEGMPLTAEYNAWTIAKNVPDDMDDIVPILITRNVDARSLASDSSSRNLERGLYFDNEWNTPFGPRGFIMIRKGGASVTSSTKSLSYRRVYQWPHSRNSDSAEDAAQSAARPADRPLKYLAPTHEVTPGDAAYAECQKMPRNIWTLKRIKRELSHLRRTGAPIVVLWVVPCLVVFAFFSRLRWKAGARPVLPVQTAVTGIFQCCAVILYMMSMRVDSGLRQAVFVIAMIIQVSLIASIVLAHPDDRSERRDGAKYVLIAVLITISAMILVVMAVMVFSIVLSMFA